MHNGLACTETVAGIAWVAGFAVLACSPSLDPDQLAHCIFTRARCPHDP